jgi:acyl carrier protein
MSQVFGLPVGAITDTASADTIESWDSVKHMSLVLALEEEFQVSFADEKIVELLSCDAIFEALRAAGATDQP